MSVTLTKLTDIHAGSDQWTYNPDTYCHTTEIHGVSLLVTDSGSRYVWMVYAYEGEIARAYTDTLSDAMIDAVSYACWGRH